MLALLDSCIRIGVYLHALLTQLKALVNAQISTRLYKVIILFNLDTKYLVKAFYDSTNTTDSDISAIIGTPSSSTDFTTSNTFINPNGPTIYFSYYLGKRVLGGPLVWNQAAFTQNFVLNPHYKFRIRFSLILGDGLSSSGDFRYTVGGFPETPLSFTSGTDVTNNIGASTVDKFI